MSYPPHAGSAAPPDQPTAAGPPIVPGQTRADVPHTPPHAPAAPPQRRSAFAEGMDRVRRSATTEPGRLRIIGAVLAALVVLFGAVTAWQVTDRAEAADDVLTRSQPLSRDAAEIYRSLADANTTAASGFLAGGAEPRSVRQRYEKDIDQASKLLVQASANSQGSAATREKISKLNRLLPQYTAAIETARANNRQGLPLGGAYLRYANDLMERDDGLLAAAQDLYQAETAQLNRDYARAKSWPWAALALGVLALAALVWAQRRHYRRTNRVFNQGLVTASALTAAVLLWLAAGHTFARSGLEDSDKHGAQSLQVLNEARINALQAHGNEGLKMVSRGAVVRDDQDAYELDYSTSMKELAGTDDRGRAGSMMDQALALADDDAGRKPVQEAVEGVRAWQGRHEGVLKADNDGDYETAVRLVIGTGGEKSTGQCFDKVDSALAKAIDHEQSEFKSAASGGRDALGGLWIGAAVLAVLGAAGALLGVGRRLSEYR
ncbi:hypothetical protein AB0M28_20540 [Streptomyces sp. NPDC051940]|uniref:hypothetical protein n=1 Tax=Streptomyces sp. NPDC051940 TaxID=3155675 RepID=UPI00343B95D9